MAAFLVFVVFFFEISYGVRPLQWAFLSFYHFRMVSRQVNVRDRRDVARRNNIFIKGVSFNGLLFRVFFGILFFFFYMLNHRAIISRRRIAHRVVTYGRTMATISVPICNFQCNNGRVAFQRVRFFRFIRFVVRANKNLRVSTSLMSMGTNLRVSRIIFKAFLRVFIVTFLLRLFYFRRIAQIMFMEGN